jgi:hypothetical protein
VVASSPTEKPVVQVPLGRTSVRVVLAEDQIGSNILADSSPLHRMWRDASIATRHGVVATDPGLEICGRALVGPEGNITPFT